MIPSPSIQKNSEHKEVQSIQSIKDKRSYVYSSFIQTILSALEFHQIMPFGSRAVPPVGNHTLP